MPCFLASYFYSLMLALLQGFLCMVWLLSWMSFYLGPFRECDDCLVAIPQHVNNVWHGLQKIIVLSFYSVFHFDLSRSFVHLGFSNMSSRSSNILVHNSVPQIDPWVWCSRNQQRGIACKVNETLNVLIIYCILYYI